MNKKKNIGTGGLWHEIYPFIQCIITCDKNRCYIAIITKRTYLDAEVATENSIESYGGYLKHK